MLPKGLYTQIAPQPVARPALVVWNQLLATELGVAEASEHEQAAYFSGNALPPQAQPLAMAYAGHQFGHLSILGDGRAHLLGEHQTPAGTSVDIQLKGSGRTPYSRSGDGRAALAPMLREYLMGEAMHALGIPTTRILAVVATGEPVFRGTALDGAIATRVAASHIRVGTFEYAAVQQQQDWLKALVSYALQRHFPDYIDTPSPALTLLQQVAQRQIQLVVNWMRVGFIHGVMNTDNMAVSGETIDYGPCAFMDAYHPGTVFSAIDSHGRYAYGNQPGIMQWNLARFAEALLPLLAENMDDAIALAEKEIAAVAPAYQQAWQQMMGRKLGLQKLQQGDGELMQQLLDIMQHTGSDYTHTFRALSEHPKQPDSPCLSTPQGQAWHRKWLKRFQQQENTRAAQQTMLNTNPAVIPRNHKVEEVLAASTTGDLTPLHRLIEVLRVPYGTPKSAPATDLAAALAALPPQNLPRHQTFCGT